MNPHPNTSWMSCIQPLWLQCELLEDGVNHDTPIKNNETNFEPEDEIAATLWEELTTLLNIDGEERLTPSHVNPHGFNTVMGDRSPLGGLQEATFQSSMECKRCDLV